MNQGNSNLNTSSLIDLKAELHKKYESFRNLKLNQSTVQPQPKRTHFKNKGEAVKGKKLKQTIEQSKEVDNEEEISLKKSRLALETKAKLYENIMSNNIDIDEEQKDCYLVDFERKVLYNSKEFENKEFNEVVNNSDTAESISSYKGDLKSKTFLKQESSTNQRDDSLQEKTGQPIHYQNVQYNEVRDHGTGYFAFSVDESKRKEQMEELGILRQETEEQRIKNQRLQRKRKALLEARLAKICERKNIDQSVLKTYVESSDEITETKESDTSQTSEVDLSAIPLPEMQTNSEKEQQTEKKPRKIRPWDVGKDNLLNFIPEKKIKSQNQWIEEKREERHAEFAPPPSYSNYKI